MKQKFLFLSVILAFGFQQLVANAQELKTGSMRITTSSAEILGADMAGQFESLLDPEKEVTWLVYVPESYNPDNPPGVLLYQIYNGEVREPNGWRAAMEEKNMIFVQIFEGGQITQRRELFQSILGPTMIQQRYKIDPTRVYTSANHGCRAAGNIAKTYPNIIKGAVYINCIPATWRKDEPELVHLMRDNRYLFFTGKFRSEQVDVRREMRKYREAGIENIKFIRTSRLKPSDNLDRVLMLEAIDYLDGNDGPAEDEN